MKKFLFIASLLFITIKASAQTPESKHFTIQKLSDGVYAAIAKPGGYGICNAGIIDLGDFTLIFDPFMTPEAAQDLKKAAKELTGHDVKYVVNSHYHNDHIGGNQVFKGATIISTETTRELIESKQKESLADMKNTAPVKLDELKKKNTSKMDQHGQEDYKMTTGYYEGIIKNVDSINPTSPDITFIDRLVIHGSKHRALLMSYGSGHTESDLFLFLPVEQIAFVGDILFVQCNPWMADGNPDKWSTYLNNLSGLSIKTMVPGHGPVGGASDVDALKAYFKNIDDVAESYSKKGKSPEEDASLTAPAPFDKWYLSDFYKANVVSEYNRLYKK
jgi:cyclase